MAFDYNVALFGRLFGRIMILIGFEFKLLA